MINVFSFQYGMVWYGIVCLSVGVIGVPTLALDNVDNSWKFYGSWVFKCVNGLRLRCQDKLEKWYDRGREVVEIYDEMFSFERDESKFYVHLNWHLNSNSKKPTWPKQICQKETNRIIATIEINPNPPNWSSVQRKIQLNIVQNSNSMPPQTSKAQSDVRSK